jgi:hypothetical protein
MASAPTTHPAHGIRNLVAAVVATWFLLALAGSLLGVFDSEPRPPIPLGLTALLPVLGYGLLYSTSSRFRDFVLSLDLRLLTLAQTWRVGGIVFLILYGQGALPGTFALPAGWGDIAIGLTAPVVAWSCLAPLRQKTFITWNVLGMLDLVLAVTLGVLASATPLGILAQDVSTRLMGQFPLSLIPTFFVPILLIFHLISLSRVRKERSESDAFRSSMVRS